MTWREEVIGDCRLILGDCLEVMPTLGVIDHVISDPPYEAIMQSRWGVLSNQAASAHVKHVAIGFDAIDDVRDDVARAAVEVCQGWLVLFCMAEGVRAWRDAIEQAGARYKRAMVWVKPDAMPQFNGQGPSVGHEMLVSAWCAPGKSKWNGGGRPGTFVHVKNTQGGEHPTQKPLPLMLELVSLFSSPHETILDCFMGSGTTGVAAARLGRKFIGIEQNEQWFDLSRRRIEAEYRQPRMFAEPAPKPHQQGLDL